MAAGIAKHNTLSAGAALARLASHAGHLVSGVPGLGAGLSDATTASPDIKARIAGGFSGGAWALSGGLTAGEAGMALAKDGYSHTSALKLASGVLNVGAAIADTVGVFDPTASVAPKVASALWAAGSAAQVGAAWTEQPAKQAEDATGAGEPMTA
jgi:hypothetical protein